MINIEIQVGKIPEPRKEWTITKRTYRIGGTEDDAFSGTVGKQSEEQNTPEFLITFDYDKADIGKSTTIFSQLIIWSKKIMNGKVVLQDVKDYGITGKKDDPTLTMREKR